MAISGRLLVALLLVIAASGCADTRFKRRDDPEVVARIVLDPGRFHVIQTVQGNASCPYLFWIAIPSALSEAMGFRVPIPLIAIQLGDAELHERAMRDLHDQVDMIGKPRLLHNFIEDWSVAGYLGLFGITRLTVTAELIEFVEGTEE
jgi:hypothetical protein